MYQNIRISSNRRGEVCIIVKCQTVMPYVVLGINCFTHAPDGQRIYKLLFFLSVILIMLSSELDFLTAFSAVGATLNNLGPGLGDVASNYASLDADVKWVLMFNMMLGRLEIFTLLVLLTPAYWRR